MGKRAARRSIDGAEGVAPHDRAPIWVANRMLLILKRIQVATAQSYLDLNQNKLRF